jgi:hypothetical protein
MVERLVEEIDRELAEERAFVEDVRRQTPSRLGGRLAERPSAGDA